MILKIHSDIVIGLAGTASGAGAGRHTVVRNRGVIGDPKVSVSSDSATYTPANCPGIVILGGRPRDVLDGRIAGITHRYLAAPDSAQPAICAEIELIC